MKKRFEFLKETNLHHVSIMTERLILKAITMEYTEVIFKNFKEDIVTYMIPKPAENISETEEFIIISLKGLTEGNNLQLVILNRENNEFLGCAGLLVKENVHEPELGIWLKKDVHGKGMGFETIQGMRNWAEQNIKYDYLIYPVDRKNTASRRIPEKLGGKIFKEEKLPTQNNTVLDSVIYRLK